MTRGALLGGITPLNVTVDQARLLVAGQALQMRLRKSPRNDQIDEGVLAWLREPFAMMPWADRLAPTSALLNLQEHRSAEVHFLADGRKPAHFGQVRFARTMPRQLSRAFLKIVSAEVDQLQRWSPQDQAALGLSREDYIAAWNVSAAAVASFGGNPHGLRWADNPQVNIITFRLVRQNIDAWLAQQRGASAALGQNGASAPGQREAVAHRKLAAAVPETAAAGSTAPDMPVQARASLATPSGHERT